MSIFDSLFGGESGAGSLQDGFSTARRQYNRKLDWGLDRVAAGRDRALDSLNAALDGFGPVSQTANAGSRSYGDALGLNGAAGTTRATDQFQAGPGYQFALDQGLDALDRRAASRGMLGSGNTATDTINYAQGQANQEYGSYLDRLSGLNTQAAQIAGAKANIYGNKAQTSLGAGNTQAGLITGVGNTIFNGQMQNRQQQVAAQQANDNSGFGALFGGLSLGGKFLGIGGF